MIEVVGPCGICVAQAFERPARGHACGSLQDDDRGIEAVQRASPRYREP